ncbi:MAG TPA: diacylglycerol kinase family protein [Candidatus Angelobacter sp.]|nr:diacylglycerol kinase family protein [Candidatus Angelobacter sp.]
MQKAFLIYNPTSGRRRAQRVQHVSQMVEVLRAADVQVEICVTTHAGSAMQQAKEAADKGYDTLLSCGGDGTANEVLNGLMQSSADAALGILPLGSGNLLACDLGLPSDPVAAARKLLTLQPCVFRPGVVTSQIDGVEHKRYFLVAAGVGSDAELMYRTSVASKERWGRNAYFLEMARMALHGRYPMFQVEWEDEQGVRRQGQASLAMAVRARKFPGLLRFVNLGSGLLRDDFFLMVFRTNKVRRFLSYFTAVATGRNWKVPDVDAVHSKWFRCTQLPGGEMIHTEADGELLGTVPAEISIAERSVKLLME